jgi:hypothetical protein
VSVVVEVGEPGTEKSLRGTWLPELLLTSVSLAAAMPEGFSTIL